MGQTQHPQAFICGTTAALFWRGVHAGLLSKPQPCEVTRIKDNVTGYAGLRSVDLSPLGLLQTDCGVIARCSEKTIRACREDSSHPLAVPIATGMPLLPGRIMPLDLAVGNRSQRNVTPAVCAHIMSGRLPSNAFLQVSNEILVTSPELTFIQMCSKCRKLLPAVEFGLELCGRYALGSTIVGGTMDASPVMDAEGLRAFVSDKGLPRGVRLARRAAEWIVDGLASPRESEVYLVMVLPVKLGGFALPKPEVNVVIPLKGTVAEALTKASVFVADLLYADKMVIVEYDGRDDHEGDSEAVIADKQRRSVFAALGYKVIVITRKDLKDADTLQRKMAQIALALGVSLETPSNEEKAAQKALVKWLFNPEHDHLPFGFGFS